jgi:hypothetical protein
VQLVVGDASRSDDGLGPGEGAPPLLARGQGPGQRAQDARSHEAEPRLFGDAQGSPEPPDRLVAPSFRQGRATEIKQVHLLEAPCPEPRDEVFRLGDLLATAPELAEAEGGEVSGVAGDDLGPPMPDPRGGLGGGRRRLQHLRLRAEVGQRVRDLRGVGHLDAAQAVAAGDLDAFAEARVRADHAPARVFRVAEPAQGRRLELRRAGPARQLQAAPVLVQAARDVAAGEAKVAAQEVDAGEFGEQPLRLRRRLGAGQVRECAVQVVGDALNGGEPDQGPAALRLPLRRGEGLLVGRARPRHGAEVVQDVPAVAGELEAVGPLRGELRAALDQAQRGLVAVLGRLRARRLQVGPRRPGVLRPVEVLGAQRRVAPRAGEPGAARRCSSRRRPLSRVS